jgi:predicted nuclease with TOPRIM domain
MDINTVLPQVAGGGTILVVGYGARMFMEWVSQIRSGKLEEKKLELAEDAQQVTDAAAANAIILTTLQAMQAEDHRKDAKIQKLEARNAEKDERIEKLQDEVRQLRAQVQALLEKLDGVDFELDDLRDNH